MKCPHRLEVRDAGYHPGGTALRIEVIPIMPRCIQKRPEHWPESMSGIRWLASGGSILVFGLCTNCKEGKYED